ncbi:MAG: FAD-binding protein [Deltaproteobacteria bacterium]|nr:FAD-binding protein [Deltaproteobacteria bacterium]MBW2447543.1 FAD-binding protein [Deltaproteobacteria bacterium]
MESWRNWSGKLHAEPREILRPASEDAVVAEIARAHDAGASVRCVGAAHSHAPLAVTDGHLLDMEAFAGVAVADRDRRIVTVGAGTRLYQLGVPLRAEGLGLVNMGDINRQAIAGVIATGTHGTGETLKNFSSAVVGLRIALADGPVVECDAEHDGELFQAARLGLGSVGVVLSANLAVREAYRLREGIWLEDLDSVLARTTEFGAAHRHFEFFWFPGRAKAVCKHIDETQDPPEYPMREGARVGWSFEVLPSHRPDKHTEMEYSVPAERGPACFAELRDLLTRDFPDFTWPLEYRTVAADDVWLSMAHGRSTVTISVHQDVGLDDEPVFRACEEVFLRHEGRPHWGKVHYLGGDTLAERYPQWHDWWRVRDAYDPTGLFLNEAMAALRP